MKHCKHSYVCSVSAGIFSPLNSVLQVRLVSIVIHNTIESVLKQKVKIKFCRVHGFMSLLFKSMDAYIHKETWHIALLVIAHQGGKDSWQTPPCMANPHQGCSVSTLGLNSRCLNETQQGMENAGISQMSRESCVSACMCLCKWEVVIAPDVKTDHLEACLTALCCSHYSK